MDDYKKIQDMIAEMEREIIDLKTSHSIAPVVKTFYDSITPSSTDPITISYGEGENDIITDVYTDADAVLGEVSDNTQQIFFSSQASLDVIVVSTRPILSITQ